jgi:dihydropyrimidinase
MDTIIENGNVVTPEGVSKLDLLIDGGRIVGRASPGTLRDLSAGERIDADGLHVFPGVVDPHTHIGLGGEKDWGTETTSAAIGGVTSVVNSVITSGSYHEAVARELELAGSQSYVDYALHLCPCMPEHLEEFDDYISRYGITSFKYFMHFRGDEGAYLDISGTDDSYLFAYLKKAAAHRGVTANVHAENIEVVWQLRAALERREDDGLVEFEASRPDFVEAEAAFRAMMLGSVAGARTYVVHLSSKLGLEAIPAVGGIYPYAELFVETCPHFLTHTVDSALGSLGKINPPLRRTEDVEALWEGLASGAIQTVGSDHAARTREQKTGDIWKIPASFPGSPTILTVLLSEGHHRRGLPLERIAEVSAAEPARIFGLGDRKGRLEPGYDADVVLVDLDNEREIVADTWGAKEGRFNLFEGWRMRGWPVRTIARGTTIVAGGELLEKPGRGEYLSRDARGGDSR